MQSLSPLDPRRPLHVLHICIATFNCPKGILGMGGGGKHLKQTERRQFHIFNDKRHNLSIFRTHAQKEYRKFLEMKGTYILNILEFLLFENLQRIY